MENKSLAEYENIKEFLELIHNIRFVYYKVRKNKIINSRIYPKFSFKYHVKMRIQHQNIKCLVYGVEAFSFYDIYGLITQVNL